MSIERRISARDRGIRRISALTSWTVGGGLLASGGFGLLAAHQFDDHARAVAAVNTQDAAASSTASAESQSADPGAAAPTTAAPALQAPTTALRPATRSTVPATHTTPTAAPKVGSGATSVHTPTTVHRPVIVPATLPPTYVPVTQAPRRYQPPVVSGGS